MIKNFVLRERLKEIKSQISEKLINSYLEQLIKNDFVPNGYTFFTSSEEINNWGRAYFDYFKEKESEYKSASYESSDSKNSSYPYPVFDWYCGYYYININKSLRDSSNEENKRIEIINNEINKFVLKQDIICVRRVPNNFFENYLLKEKKPKSGEEFSDKAFVSTSLYLFHRKDTESNYRPLKTRLY